MADTDEMQENLDAAIQAVVEWALVISELEEELLWVRGELEDNKEIVSELTARLMFAKQAAA